MVPFPPLSKRILPRLRAANPITMRCKLTPLCFFLPWFSNFLYCVPFYSVETTPPPMPSPVKAASGKKRAMAIEVHDSDSEDVFVPRYDIDPFVIFKSGMF